jgi:hypothetical protein
MSGYFTDSTTGIDGTRGLVFSADQVYTTAGGEVVSDNVIDCQATPTLRDLSINPMFVEVFVTALTGVTSAVLKIITHTAATGSVASGTDLATLAFPAVAVGTRFVLPIPVGPVVSRYLSVSVTPTGGTSIQVKAYLVPSAAPQMQYFPDGSSIVAG